VAHQDAGGRRYDLAGHGRQVLAEETVRLTRLAATAQRRLRIQHGTGM
jgi:hypothetical protein